MKAINALYPVAATTVCLSLSCGFAHAQKAAAAPYIAQVKVLLPTLVPIENTPGEDSADLKEGGNKLFYESLLPVYIRLASAQKRTGDVAGAQATFARAQALCVQGKEVNPDLVKRIISESFRVGLYSEALATSNKYDKDGTLAPVVAEYQARLQKDLKAADATLVAGVKKGKVLETADDFDLERRAQLLDSLDTAVRHNLPGAITATRAAFVPMLKKMQPAEVCRAYRLGVPGISAEVAEAKMRKDASSDDEAAKLAIGLFDLNKPDQAKALLGKMDKESRLPSALILHITPAEFITLARRIGNDDALLSAISYLKDENRDTPDVIFLLQAAIHDMAPDSSNNIGASEYASDALALLPRAAAATPTLQKQGDTKKADFLEDVKRNAKTPAKPGSLGYQVRQSYSAGELVGIVPFDPEFVKKQLPLVTQPCYRAQVLVALANHYAKG